MKSITQSLTIKNDKGENIFIDFNRIRKSSLILRAVNHKLRQQILQLLERESKLTVTDIYMKMAIEQSVASQHLAILRRAKFVETSRQGKYIYYSVSDDKFQEISKVLDILV